MKIKTPLFFLVSVFIFITACSVVNKVTGGGSDQPKSRTLASLPTVINGHAQFANWKNHKVRFEEFGHGSEEAIVFIHGWACDSSFWNFQIDDFSQRQRVITIDLPGHGKSDHPSSLKYSVEEFTDAVNAVFDTAGIRKAIIVGHSLGGVVVRNFYRLYPQKVIAMVIADSELGPWPKDVIDVTKRKSSELRNGNYKKILAEMVDTMFASTTPEFLKNEIKRKMTSTAKPVMSKALAGLLEQKLYKTDSIKVPTMVIRAKTQYLNPGNESFLRGFIPDLNYQEWDNVGHFVMMEDPEKFNQAVLKFLVNKRL